MSQPMISVEHLSKAYRLGMKEEIPDTFVGAFTGWLKAPLRNWKRLQSLNTFNEPVAGPAVAEAEEPSANGNGQPDDILWALKDVSFEVNEGEVVGIIGRNGAGKSTLLKILSRITEPTHGRAVIRGRVSSLLEVGTGFHPELTGRENIYMNGTILGMRKKEIDKKFDEIVDFSGVEKFLDTPIKRYSSGMNVRLAFAVAAHLEPEILIIDEVLAVGDAEFQRKCLGKMQDVAAGGRTVLFVSHNMAAVQNLCQRAVILKGGSLKRVGPVDDIVNFYLSEMSGRIGTNRDLRSAEHRSGQGDIRVEWVQLQDDNHKELATVMVGKPAVIAVGTHVYREAAQYDVLCTIYDSVGNPLTNFHSRDRLQLSGRVGNTAIVRCRIDRIPLVPGPYRLNLAVVDQTNVIQDRIEGALSFNVEGGDFFGTGKLPSGSYSKFYVDHDWEQR